ncbi:hypothetical protein halTADL_1381 [Halohasta litchfieldiae]|jgi:hypothetical protein|uniref:DUF8160 domain-containing protein n=1 Tax=Halohasta litchfieldiae TaxID=1073996 RepID=A0A1H6W0G1_9EURY|nr:hypothetical protein [Halohasta litchfieldiae]ATW88157.1 hypothetical protein halTADL_1381 [Halohasta litchfieldiae]SEJ10383.1 hypothetical protein SAMN05444271_12133 [Halohasta litchfieldiae]
MSDDEGEDRASRLRNRRNKTREKAKSGTEKMEKEAKSDKESTQSKPSKTNKISVKEDRPAQMMYLPESMQREMNRQFGMIETEYEYEFSENFEKNRHYFPLLIKAGLDSLDGLDIKDIKDKLDSFDG